jgi:hypothetical protein
MNGWALAFVLAAHTLPKQDAQELRPRITFSGTAELSKAARVHVDGIVEALAADRKQRGGRVKAISADARDAWIEAGGTRADIRAGYGRLAWGRLDEVQPSDVINPIDTARFFLEGRSEARLPVGFARARIFPSSSVTIEGVLVPFFRRSTFDSLDEKTSPFNLIPGVPQPDGPDAMQGGGRVSATLGRVDVSTSVYRGTDTFISPQGFRRFTMVAGDFETVTGAWAIRGESAVRIGQAFDIGAGVDRKTGEFRLFASAIVHRDFATPFAASSTNFNAIGSIERKFGRDRYLARAFAIVNPDDRSAFVRGLFLWSATDQVSLEVSAAKFAGTGDDGISRFAGRDFAGVRLRWYIH